MLQLQIKRFFKILFFLYTQTLHLLIIIILISIVYPISVRKAMNNRINIVWSNTIHKFMNLVKIRVKTIRHTLNKHKITKTRLLYLYLERLTQPLRIRHIAFLSASRELFILLFYMIWMKPFVGSVVNRFRSLSIA
jgi:hypothetical protein